MSVLPTSVGPAPSREPGAGMRQEKGCWKEGELRGLLTDCLGSWVSERLVRMLRRSFPQSPEGEACFKDKNAGSPPPWLGAAPQQLPPTPRNSASERTRKSAHVSSQAQRGGRISKEKEMAGYCSGPAPSWSGQALPVRGQGRAPLSRGGRNRTTEVR